MSHPKFELKFLGVHVSAEGVLGIIAVLMLVGGLMAFYVFRA
jgi:hypothetical protein